MPAREPIDVHPGTQEEQYPYPYFVDYVKRWFLANKAFGRTYDDRYRLLFTGGLRITTTLDPAVQAAAQDAVSSVLTLPERSRRSGHGARPAHRVRPRDGRRSTTPTTGPTWPRAA